MLMTEQQGHNLIGNGTTSLPTPNIICQTAIQSTWLPGYQNSPSLVQPLDFALEPPQQPSLPPPLKVQDFLNPKCKE